MIAALALVLPGIFYYDNQLLLILEIPGVLLLGYVILSIGKELPKNWPFNKGGPFSIS
jgi:hypothetical protein